MAKSIMPFNIKGRCYICKADCPTETHHIFQGSNRKASEDMGLTIECCRICHTRIHRYPKHFDNLKSNAQRIAMEKNRLTLEEWRELFRKNYL